MARVKNEAVREAILAAATREFTENGYINTTISRIARTAGTSPSNVYVYFTSKVEIAIAVYEPWYMKRITELGDKVCRSSTPEKKVSKLIDGLFRDIASQGYTIILVQALATAGPADQYRPDLLKWTEARIAEMIKDISAAGSQWTEHQARALAHILMLIFDGIAVRRNLNQPTQDSEDALGVLSRILATEPG